MDCGKFYLISNEYGILLLFCCFLLLVFLGPNDNSPLLFYVQVDYTTVFVFRLLMFVDNGLAAGMGL